MRFLFCLLILFLAGPAFSKPILHTAVDAGWAQMAVGGPNEDFVYTVRHVLIQVEEGDLLDIYAEGQARNDLGYNVEFGMGLYVRDCVSGSYPPSYNNDFWADLVGPPNGWNITANAHYGRASKGYVYTVPAGKSCVSVELRLRARSTGTSGGVVNLAIQGSQGLLQVKQWK